MMKTRYRLEAMLRIKLRDKKRAEILLAKAITFFNEAKKKLEELKEEKKKICLEQKESRKKMDVEMNAGGKVGKGCFHVNYLRKLKEDEAAKEEEIKEQEGVIEEAKEKVAKARRAYIDAAKQMQIMDKHKELWTRKIKKEISRREEKEMDELGQTIHGIKRWRGEKSVFEG
ncbi:MAG: hypothetical protein Q7T03_05815 [Deltaproteobacteria bacterium]|nr:hypothetical protein [Deltaproteobacteria bacterium]